MIYLVLAVLFLYLISLPLVVTADIYIDYDNDHGVVKFKLWFFTVYKKIVNISAFKQKIEGITDDKDRSVIQNDEKSETDLSKKKFAIDLLKHAAERVRVRDIDFRLRLGTGDAAVSAFVVGMIKISYESLCAFLNIDKEKASIEAVYDNEYIFLAFFGIISISFADIIYAVCATLLSRLPQRRRYANTVTE